MQERFQNVYTLIERNKKFAYNLFNEAESISTKVKAITRLCTTSLCNISSESANFMMMNSTIILNELIKTRLDIESTIHVCNNLLNFLNARMKPNEVKKPHNESKPNDNQLIDTKKSTDEDFFTPMPNKQRRRTRRNDISSNMNKYLGVLRDWKQVRLGVYDPLTRLSKIIHYKIKKIIKRSKKKIIRKYPERSRVAKIKLRYKGKFIRKDTIKRGKLFQVHTY